MSLLPISCVGPSDYGALRQDIMETAHYSSSSSSEEEVCHENWGSWSSYSQCVESLQQEAFFKERNACQGNCCRMVHTHCSYVLLECIHYMTTTSNSIHFWGCSLLCSYTCRMELVHRGSQVLHGVGVKRRRRWMTSSLWWLVSGGRWEDRRQFTLYVRVE